MQRSLFLLFFFISICAKSQVNAHLFVDGDLKENIQFKDSLEWHNYIHEFNLKSIKDGYFFAGVDSIVELGNGINTYLHRGIKSESEIAGFNKKSLSKIFNKRISYLADNGYPFSSIRMDSLKISKGSLAGNVIEEKGPYIRNDSSFFYTKLKTNSEFIYLLLEYIPGEPFKESGYQTINEKIERFSFLSFNRPVDISFQNEKAKLYLDIREEESGSFQGVLGLQQQDAGKTNVVGSFDLNIQNLFKSGKELSLNWERFRENSQELAISYRHPFIFKSKLTPFFQFDLLKQDSIFLKRSTTLGASTYLSSKVELFIGYTKKNGSLLTTDEQALSRSDLADFDSDSYQIKLRRGRFNRISELKSGSAWEISAGLGVKKIEKNLNLNNSFYDTLTLKTDIFEFNVKTIINYRLLKRQVLFQHFEGGIIKNSELLNNERYRLGGLNSLRGFNEKSLFADQYFLSRTEFRSYFEKGSFVYAFFDQLLFKNDEFADYPFGVGVGFSLSTLSGQFSFALAIGKSKNQKVDLSNMKVHFGYITKF